MASKGTKLAKRASDVMTQTTFFAIVLFIQHPSLAWPLRDINNHGQRPLRDLTYSDQYQYLGNCAPTPPVTYYNMFGLGKGMCAVAQILILIHIFYLRDLTYSTLKFMRSTCGKSRMVDNLEDFFQGKSRCSYNTCETKSSLTFPVFPSKHA